MKELMIMKIRLSLKSGISCQCLLALDDNEIKEAREKAHEISRIAMWDSLVKHYFTAYEHALDTQQRKKRRTQGICKIC